MKDVHTEHCCLIHGCKYCSEECTVISGEKEQSFKCEECDYEDNQRSVWSKCEMSNEQMVSVPREMIVEAIISSRMMGWSLAEKLSDILAQHQGEPVALPGYRDTDLRSPSYGYSRGFNACLDEIAKLNGWPSNGE